MPARRLSRSLGITAAASCVVFFVPSAVVDVASATAPAAAVAANLTTCSLPVTHDIYDGFHVGVPAGWDLSTLGGEISVAPTATSAEGAILYPALLSKGVSASSVFSAFMSYEQRSVERSGGVFNYQTRTGAGGLPVASVLAETNGKKLGGEATVTVVPLGTQFASEEAVVSLDYAPRANFGADAPTLSAIGGCYGPERAIPFAVFHVQGDPFTFIMPPGWHVGTEGQDDIELENTANTASATFDLWGPFVEGVNISQPVGTPAEAIGYWFAKLGLEGADVLSTIKLGQQAEYMEFTATLNGKSVHGLMYMVTSTSAQATAGVFRLALAGSALWNQLNGALVEMAGSIQHDFTQDLEEIQAVNRQWQDFSGQVSNFDDTLNDQQLVQDPNTGTFYEAPYSSYIVDGPDGPGYYLPSGQRLNPVERP